MASRRRKASRSTRARSKQKPRQHPKPHPKRRPSPTRPADWYTSLPGPEARRREKRYLQDTIKELRRVYKGFEASEGYDATRTETWSAQRRRQVQDYGGRVHNLKSTQHVIVSARTAQQHRALRLKTGQLSPRQKAYVIHVPAPESTRVRFVRERGVKGVRAEIVRKVTDGEVFIREYLFREVTGSQPQTFKAMRSAMAKMLSRLPSTVAGEEAYYTLLSEPHGPISTPVPKSMLLEKFQDWHDEYGTAAYIRLGHEDFAEQVIGVRLMGTRTEAFTEANERLDRRARYQLDRRARYQRVKRQLQRERRRIDRGGRLTGRVGRI